MSEISHIKPLKHLKKGDTCWVLTDTYIPEIGDCFYVTKVTVEKINTKTLSVKSGNILTKYNLPDGSQVVDVLQTYRGTTSHHLYNTKSVIDAIIKLKNNGCLFHNLPQEILDLIAKKEAEAITV